MLQVISQGMNAQKTAVYEGLTYYLDKKEAFDTATVQGKQVFLFWGSVSCSRCNQVKKNLAHRTLTSILQEHYILWYCDDNEYSRGTPEVIDYLSVVPTPNVPYPALCIIDTFDITKAHGLVWGKTLTVSQLYDMLTKYVANDYIDDDKRSNNAYISRNKLIVKSDATKEEIIVYAVTGSQVDKFNKTEPTLMRDASSYPSGILIIAGSSGWARKVILKRN
ncbi:MAG: hypothetical protein LBG28_08155 [Tannerella sp.]|jgi:hypothetical protein|nr:hypothetical protein [Tannerella sp.]